MEKMSTLTLILLSVSGVYTDTHSMRYFYTGVSNREYGLPEFFKIGYVDDQLTELYSSDIGKTIPLAPWIKQNVDPEYWRNATQIDKDHEALFRHEIKVVMNRFNHTGGPYVVQVIEGCEVHDDGSILAYKWFRYDGEDYMYLDMQTGTYIPTRTEAWITTQRWNSPDLKMGERRKNYLQNNCIEILKKFVECGREELERKVRPMVKIKGQVSSEVTKLHCLVYGFHPRAVDVKWKKNGVDDIPSYGTTQILPNPDGTYQVRVTVEEIPKEGDTYSCYVDHSSLEEPLLVKWEPEKASTLVVIVGVVIVLILTSVTAGVILYKSECQDTNRNEQTAKIHFQNQNGYYYTLMSPQTRDHNNRRPRELQNDKKKGRYIATNTLDTSSDSKESVTN